MNVLSGVIICWAKCEPCMFGSHYDEPTWHTWAGVEDVEHASNTGQPDPRVGRCACACAGNEPTL